MTNNKGFSIVEIVIGMALLSIVTLVGFRVLNANDVTNTQEAAQSEASSNAEPSSVTSDSKQQEPMQLSEICRLYDVDLPEGWMIIPNASTDCYIQSYENDPSNPDIPAQGPYLDEISIAFFVKEATMTLSEIKESETKIIGVPTGDIYPPTIESVDDAIIGDYDAVKSRVKDGHLAYIYDSYKFVVDDQQHTIVITSENEERLALAKQLLASLVVR